MKLQSILTQRLLLLAAIVASSTIAILPAEAASFARARAALAIEGLLSDSTESTVEGDSDRYFTTAQANPITTLSITSTTDFTFDFTASLNLQTLVDNPDLENASTAGEVAFSLFDTNSGQLLDTFSIFGFLNTLGEDFLSSPDRSDFVQITSLERNTNFSPTQTSESASTIVRGIYSRSFEKEVALTLVAGEFSRACAQNPKAPDPCVQVPESSNTVALLLLGGSIVVVGLHRRSARKRLIAA
ncbi:hypothetical protein ACKFKG_02010 [Phormidesmis sp. 146-35]